MTLQLFIVNGLTMSGCRVVQVGGGYGIVLSLGNGSVLSGSVVWSGRRQVGSDLFQVVSLLLWFWQ